MPGVKFCFGHVNREICSRQAYGVVGGETKRTDVSRLHSSACSETFEMFRIVSISFASSAARDARNTKGDSVQARSLRWWQAARKKEEKKRKRNSVYEEIDNRQNSLKWSDRAVCRIAGITSRSRFTPTPTPTHQGPRLDQPETPDGSKGSFCVNMIEIYLRSPGFD